MTRGYWAGVMLFSLMVTGASGWYLSTALTEKSTVEVPLKRVESAWLEEEKPQAPAEQKNEPIKVAAFAPKTDEDALGENGKRKILFNLPSSTAKKVFVVGSFNKWFRKPMIKKDNVWSSTIELAPGTYEYKFVVDNKRVKDPNNKTTSKAGNSVLIVKPASAS